LFITLAFVDPFHLLQIIPANGHNFGAPHFPQGLVFAPNFIRPGEGGGTLQLVSLTLVVMQIGAFFSLRLLE
jgi:hypothetical protein